MKNVKIYSNGKIIEYRNVENFRILESGACKFTAGPDTLEIYDSKFTHPVAVGMQYLFSKDLLYYDHKDDG